MELLEQDLSEQQLNTWIRPLHAIEGEDQLRLLAPNRFVLDWVKGHHLEHIRTALAKRFPSHGIHVLLEIGSSRQTAMRESAAAEAAANPISPSTTKKPLLVEVPSENTPKSSNLNPDFTFDNFVEGKSNQLARAACLQVTQNPGKAYNPLCIYGGTGLGKTHLMHAVGNTIRTRNPEAKIAYLHS
ncbi:MAG: chromosomal replication initiator protein DnaA, partial [Candidatus Competibacteraceae bacterium]|nr:chromosomal replication initiator protein DnaA [Candidatus Competibacteraceae bacterium]